MAHIVNNNGNNIATTITVKMLIMQCYQSCSLLFHPLRTFGTKATAQAKRGWGPALL